MAGALPATARRHRMHDEAEVCHSGAPFFTGSRKATRRHSRRTFSASLSRHRSMPQMGLSASRRRYRSTSRGKLCNWRDLGTSTGAAGGNFAEEAATEHQMNNIKIAAHWRRTRCGATIVGGRAKSAAGGVRARQEGPPAHWPPATPSAVEACGPAEPRLPQLCAMSAGR
eukprot:5498609-Pyramimonas_sp.AAC.1